MAGRGKGSKGINRQGKLTRASSWPIIRAVRQRAHEKNAWALPALPPFRPLSSRTDRNAGQEHQDTTKHHLKNGRDKRSIHVVVTDPSDNCELDRNHHDGYPGSDVKIW